MQIKVFFKKLNKFMLMEQNNPFDFKKLKKDWKKVFKKEEKMENVNIKVGDIYKDMEIEKVGEKGDGITTKQGFVIFVPDTKQGDKVTIKVTKILEKCAFAEVVK